MKGSETAYIIILGVSILETTTVFINKEYEKTI